MSYRLWAAPIFFALLVTACASSPDFTDSTRGYVSLPDGTKLKIVKLVGAEYPAALRRAGIQGEVRVRFFINPDGTTSNMTVQQSPHPWLDEFAIKAVSQWQFEPYDVMTRPVGFLTAPITFSVNK